MDALEDHLIDHAHQLGFALAGIASAAPADGFDRLRAWLDQGYAGEMNYMHVHAEARRDPRAVLPSVRSVVMVGLSYAPEKRNAECIMPETPSAAVRGRIARYALGTDYHPVMRTKLKQLGRWLSEQRPGCRGRSVVDTAPLLERDFARRAGLGWFGKNTMLLNPRHGSWFMLGALLVDVDLTPSSPFARSHCGACTACLDACPTSAFVAPHVLDARRCISYLTIELKQTVPEHLRTGVGDWLFGCDVCQDVCPWNRKALPGSPDLAPRADLTAVDPFELLGLSAETFRARFAGTALYPRPGRPAVLRNAALILGNCGDARALPALQRALEDHEPLIQEAAAWAVGQIEQRLAQACATGVPTRSLDEENDP